jgi:RNA polymerase sigma factor (sigma-70 family)
MSLFQNSREAKLSWSELQEASDPELIRQLIAGNDDAFAVIVDRYQRLVYSVALRIIKDEGEAEDIVQTIFVDILTKVGQFDPARGTLKVWLLQWAYGRSINRRHYLEHRQFYSRLNSDEIETPHSFQRRGVPPVMNARRSCKLRPRPKSSHLRWALYEAKIHKRLVQTSLSSCIYQVSPS